MCVQEYKRSRRAITRKTPENIEKMSSMGIVAEQAIKLVFCFFYFFHKKLKIKSA